MTIWAKCVNFFGFRFEAKSLGGAFVFLVAAVGIAPAAKAVPVPSSVSDCAKKFHDHFKLKIPQNENQSELAMEQWEPKIEELCKNSSQWEASPAVQDNGFGEKFCQTTYRAVVNDYQELLRKEVAEYCLQAALKAGEETCTLTNKEGAKNCVEDFKTKKAAIEKSAKDFDKAYDTAKEELSKKFENNRKLKFQFDSDTKAMAEVKASTRSEDGHYALESMLKEKRSFTVEEYENRLTLHPQKRNSYLYLEQESAEKTAEAYLEKLKELRTKIVGPLVTELGRYINKLNEVAVAAETAGRNKNDPLGLATKYGPAAASLANPNGNSPTSPSPTVSTGSTAAAALPMAAAALSAGASLSRSKSPAAISPGGPSIPNAATPPAATNFGGEGGRAPASVPHATLPGEETNAKPEAPTVAKVPTENAGLSSFGSEGSSRKFAGKFGAAPAAAAPVANSGEGESAPTDFSGGGPRSAPKPKSNAMGEVASMLNQMKSLFNMDEPIPLDEHGGIRPMEMGAGAPYQGTAATATNYTNQPSEESGDPAQAMNQEEAPVEGMPASFAAVAENQQIQMDSLFTRVHARHRKCLERGQLISHR